MANSDWPRIADQEHIEHRWVYFAPVIGQVIEDDWQFRLPLKTAFAECYFSVGDIVGKHDLECIWRKQA